MESQHQQQQQQGFNKIDSLDTLLVHDNRAYRHHHNTRTAVSCWQEELLMMNRLSSSRNGDDEDDPHATNDAATTFDTIDDVIRTAEQVLNRTYHPYGGHRRRSSSSLSVQVPLPPLPSGGGGGDSSSTDIVGEIPGAMLPTNNHHHSGISSCTMNRSPRTLTATRGGHPQHSCMMRFTTEGGIDVVGGEWGLSAAAATAAAGHNSVESSLRPDPIDSSRIEIVSEVRLGSLWQPDHDTVMSLKELFDHQGGGAAPTKTGCTTANATTTTSSGGYSPWGTLPQVARSSVPRRFPMTAMEESKMASSTSLFSALAAATTSSLSSSTASASSPYKQDQWNERYQELIQYRRVYGNCLVPHTWVHNKPLAQWVKRQRYQYKLRIAGRRSTLTDERLKMLLELGFVWNAHDALWEEKFQELVSYANEHGHCNVPSIYPPNRPLSVWVRCQRRNYKLFLKQKQDDKRNQETTTSTSSVNGSSSRRPNSTLGTGTNDNTTGCSMTEEKVRKLKDLGFSFNPRNL